MIRRPTQGAAVDLAREVAASGAACGLPVALRELGLSPEQLSAIGVDGAQRAVTNLEELGLDVDDDIRRLAAGDPDLVAAFVALHSPTEADQTA